MVLELKNSLVMPPARKRSHHERMEQAIARLRAATPGVGLKKYIHMGTKRDDFKASTINVLRTRVASRCSNPACRVPTTGPTTDNTKINNIGTAAHITAASPGGPRYDKSLTFGQRRSINNAIWLCTNCSKDIDNDPEEYSVELLKKWKKSAEDSAKEELGKPLPDDNYVIKSLTSALTGQSNIYLPKLISNACEATSQALENLDPRFAVETSYSRGMSHYNIMAKHIVDMKLSINPEYKKEFSEKYTNLIDHGEKLSISSEAIDIQGSPLIKEIQKNTKGKIEFTSAHSKEANVGIWLLSPDRRTEFRFNEINGAASLGRKSISIELSGLNGIFHLRIRLFYKGSLPIDGKFDIYLNFENWNRKQLIQLPYIDKLYEFYNKINKGWQFNFSLEIEGLHITSGHSSGINTKKQFIQDFSHLNFIYMVREISRILNVMIVYDSSFEYTAEFNLKIRELFEILGTGPTVLSRKIKGNAKCTLEIFDDLSNIIELQNMDNKITTIRIEQQEQETITPFNQNIILPKFSHILTEVIPKINSDISNLNPGDLVEIEWIPTDNCEYKIEKLETQQHV